MMSMYPSGRNIDLANFTAEDVSLGDIAHCLALTNRWGGCSSRAITIADHCMFCDKLLCTALERQNADGVRGNECFMRVGGEGARTYAKIICGCDCIDILEGHEPTARLRALVLLHDAHEAYIGDMRTPVVAELERWCRAQGGTGIGVIAAVNALKAQIDEAIYEHLGIAPPNRAEQESIRLLDRWALRLEALWYMPTEIFGDYAGALTPIEEWEEPACVGVDMPARGDKQPGTEWLLMVQEMLTKAADKPARHRHA